jgi:hypothetical protein
MFRIIRTTKTRLSSHDDYAPRHPRPARPADDLLEDAIHLSRLTFR